VNANAEPESHSATLVHYLSGELTAAAEKQFVRRRMSPARNLVPNGL